MKDLPFKVYFIHVEHDGKHYWYANKGGGAWGLSPYMVDAMPLTANNLRKVREKLNRYGEVKYKDVMIPVHNHKTVMYTSIG